MSQSLKIWMKQNGWREKLGIFSEKHVLPIPHPCYQDNSVHGEGQVVLLSLFCFKNNTEETIILPSLLFLKIQNEGWRVKPGALLLGKD